jgi:predicted Zn-dependent protease
VTAPGILTKDDCEALTRRVLELATADRAIVTLGSIARSTNAFARGETHVASEVVEVSAGLSVEAGGRQASAETNQLDEAGLRALVAEAEALAREHRTPSTSAMSVLPPQTYPKGPQIFFVATAAVMEGEPQMAVARGALEAAGAAGLVAAGDVHVEARARAIRNTQGLVAYDAETYGEFSITARSQENGSGWAWTGFEDWTRVDPGAVITRAVDLARRSANPVAIEPGRYTVILEPAAVAALVYEIIADPYNHSFRSVTLSGPDAEAGGTVFSKEPRGTTKIGLQVLDRRLSLVANPWDPDLPRTVISPSWLPLKPVVWIKNGVLQNLTYSYAEATQRGREPVLDPYGVRLTVDGPATSLEDMITSTKRGVWVNRLSNILVMDGRTVLLTGTTRDGTFLIENGKITKAIKNFRFTESPFYVFNQLEAWGEPVRASRLVVCPRVKVRDFNFTSLTDAI